MDLLALLALLTNPTVVVGLLFLWGLIVKYHPALSGVPNVLIPWLNAVIALVLKLATPTAVHAGTPGMDHPLVVLSCLGHLGGFLAPVLQSGWQAVQASLLYEVFGRNVVERGLGWSSPALPGPLPGRA